MVDSTIATDQSTAESPTVSESRLGPPFAVVAVALIVLTPSSSGAFRVEVCQVVQEPVPGNERAAATRVPLTVMSIGRSVAVPLANRRLSGVVRAPETVTVNSTELPITLS